jgi:hypothetical protein
MPSQISPPIEYNDGDPINAAAFNGHVKGATLQNGSITEQVDVALSIVPSVSKTDNLVIYDESEVTTNRLRKIKVGELLTVDSPVVAESVTTSQINAKANEQLDIAPNASVLLTGRNFVSIDGFNVTVTSTAHLLETGMLLEFSNAAIGGNNGGFVSGHDGRYQITVLTADTFTYRNGLTTATVAGSGTLNYRKAPTVYIGGSEVINDDLRVAGNTFIAGNTNISGAVNVGSLKIGGQTPLTKENAGFSVNSKTAILPPNTGWGVVDYSTTAFVVPPGETYTFVWTTMTQAMFDSGNTRAEWAYAWQVTPHQGAVSGINPALETIWVSTGVRGGASWCQSTITIRNEGTTGTLHTIITPTGTTMYDGLMSLNWRTVQGRHKWNDPGRINITLYRQKTNTIPGNSGSGLNQII